MCVCVRVLSFANVWIRYVYTRRFCKYMHFMCVFYLLQDGRTSLMHASEDGHFEVVKYLVQQGANKEAQDKVCFLCNACVLRLSAKEGRFRDSVRMYGMGLGRLYVQCVLCMERDTEL